MSVADPTVAPGYSGPAATEADKQSAVMVYVCGIFTPLVPLILLLVKKDASPFVKDQIKETLNWGITILLVNIAINIVVGILAAAIHPIFGLLGLIPLLIFVLHLILTLAKGMPTMKQGVAYRYPFALRLVK